jgi:small-conductance mechanosensitive channel
MPTRRVSVDVGVGYSTDIPKAVQIALDVIKQDSRVLADPAPAVITTELANSSVNLQLRAWVNTADFWAVKNDLIIAIHAAFGKENIEIPFPQLDVRMYKN